MNLVQSVVETLLFYHPAAWWISARIRAEREHCCDDWAVEVCGDRLTYARALAALEEQRGAGWLLAPSARDGSLLARIRRLLGATSIGRKTRRWTGRHAGAGNGRAAGGRPSCWPPPATRPGLRMSPRDAITGSVVTPDGKPVAGADVWLVTYSLTRKQDNHAGQGPN